MNATHFHEMFRAMRDGRGWVTDQEIENRIEELRNGAKSEWIGERSDLEQIIVARNREASPKGRTA
jgi:hypothetical protein